MKRILAALMVAMALGLASHGVLAADDDSPPATLHMGDAAPKLAPSKWVKGDAVDKFEPDKVYVVEFWATWCGPCKASIPHLTELQKKNPDVTFIGMDCMEQEPENVAPFVKEMGDKMDYRVAMDDATGTNSKNWLVAAGQNGIPCAFVVGKDSKVAWIGHPMEMEEPLKQIIAGTFDIKKAVADAKAREEIQAQLGKAIEAGDIGAIDKFAKEHPEMADGLSVLKFQLLMQKKDYAAAVAMGKELVETQKDNSEILNDIAWMMVDPENPIDKPDLDLAMKAALRANEVAKGENGAILDTLARVYFTRGDVDKAIEIQNKAVEKADDADRAQLTKSLAEYTAKKNAAK